MWIHRASSTSGLSHLENEESIEKRKKNSLFSQISITFKSMPQEDDAQFRLDSVTFHKLRKDPTSPEKLKLLFDNLCTRISTKTVTLDSALGEYEDLVKTIAEDENDRFSYYTRGSLEAHLREKLSVEDYTLILLQCPLLGEIGVLSERKMSKTSLVLDPAVYAAVSGMFNLYTHIVHKSKVENDSSLPSVALVVGEVCNNCPAFLKKKDGGSGNICGQDSSEDLASLYCLLTVKDDAENRGRIEFNRILFALSLIFYRLARYNIRG
jgi:hypothetical protein